MERRSRVYEYTTPHYGKGYVFARNIQSAMKKVGPLGISNGWSYYDRATKKEFQERIDKQGFYSLKYRYK